MSLTTDTKRLKRTIEDLLTHQSNDLRLRDHLEGLRRDEALPGLTWFWGPELYRRNRVVFREFILSHFSTMEMQRVGAFRWRHVKWSEHGDRLATWLAETRRQRDTWLVQKLIGWKFSNNNWGVDGAALCKELIKDYRAALSPAARAIVLEEYDLWFQLDQPTSLALYRVSPACSKFVLTHLPLKFSFWGNEKRDLWHGLFEAAQAAHDEELSFALYRRQVDLSRWQADIERLARDIADPAQLHIELKKRHLEGWDLSLINGAISLLLIRGREVMPYIREKLDSIIQRYGVSPQPLMKLARDRGWWDLWAASARSAGHPKLFNDAISELLEDSGLDDSIRVERLRALAGVSSEWNWGGFGFAQVHTIPDDIAVRLYHRYPKLVHGPFKPNVVPTWWQGGPQLLAAAQQAGDDDLVDLLASRYVTRAGHSYVWDRKQQDVILKVADDLATSFQTMRDRDERQFARRAANILTQVPAFSIYNLNSLLETNSLARLLFVRSFSAYLTVPDAIRDLVEGSDIHVQSLGYRILAQDDIRARRLAAELLDILQGTLLRPLHRKTRLAAFGALANAARNDATSAARILGRAREAFRLPDQKYPKEQLVGLIAEILHAWPDLRGPREQPVIYGLEEAVR